MTLTEKGLKFEMVPVDLMKGEHKVGDLPMEVECQSTLLP